MRSSRAGRTAPPTGCPSLSSFAAFLLAIGGCAGEVGAPPSTEAASIRTHAAALTLEVPAQHPTIQSALSAAAPGDTVHVAAGTYVENLTIPSGVSLSGSGAGSTVVKGKIVADGTSGVAIRDLSLAAPNASTVGLLAQSAGGLVVERVAMEGYAIGADVTAAPGTTARFTACTFRKNNNGLFIGGSGADGPVEVLSSVFAFNANAAVQAEATDLLVAGSTFVANGTAEEGAQIRVSDGPAELRENIVVAGGPGIVCGGSCGTLAQNDVWGNTVNYDGTSPGAGDLSADPLFVSFAEGDYRLRPESPCVDAGGVSGEPAVDHDGTPRPQGKARDLGAYELGVAKTALALSEVMANPLDEGAGEYVEIANTGTEPVDAAGLVLGDGDEKDVLVAFPGGGTVLAPGERAVVLDPDGGGVYAIPPDVVLLTVAGKALGNGLAVNDPITLFESDGTTAIDSWGNPFDPSNGVSAERIDLGAPDLPNAWKPSPCTASPGLLNCASEGGLAPDLRITEVMANPLDQGKGEFVEIANVGKAPIDLAGHVLSDGDGTDVLVAKGGGGTLLAPDGVAIVLDPDYAGGYAIAAGALLLTIEGSATLGNGLAMTDPVTLLGADGTSVAATYTHPLATPSGVSVERVVVLAGDAEGNWAPSPCTTGSSPGRIHCPEDVPFPSTLPTLALVEVMANPLDEDRGEFVEIYNFGESAVDAKGLVLSDGDAWDPLGGYAGGDMVIPAKGRAVVLDPEYAGGYSIPGSAKLLTVFSSTNLGSGLATDDPVRLLLSDGTTVVDTFLAPFNPGNGISAERKDPLGGDLPSNWAASTCPSGSSPGAPPCVASGAPPPAPPKLFLTEVMANPLDEAKEEYVELYNPGDAPVDAGGLLLDDGSGSEKIVGWKGGPAVLAPKGFGVLLDSGYAPGVPTTFAADGFDDGVLAPSWLPFPAAPAGAVLEAEGVLGMTLSAAGEVGIRYEDSVDFATRAISIEAVITLPSATGGALVRASIAFAKKAGASLETSGDLVLVRFVASGDNRNVEVVLRSGGVETILYQWQPAPFAAPDPTQGLRLVLDRANVRAYRRDLGGGDFFLLTQAAHGFDLDTFHEAVPLFVTGAGTSPSEPVTADFDDVVVAREAYEIPEGATLLTTPDASIGNGLSQSDGLTLRTADGATVVDAFSHPQATEDGYAIEKVQLEGGDTAENWIPSPCGASPGRIGCATPATYISTWIDEDHSESGHTWWRGIGWPSHFDPSSVETSCELVTVCPGHALTYQDNLAAAVPFSFTNPYPDAYVVFTERSGPTDSCFESCPSKSFPVAAGATAVVPASSLGWYYVEVDKKLNGMDYDFSFYWDPPADALQPPFQVVVGP